VVNSVIATTCVMSVASAYFCRSGPPIIVNLVIVGPALFIIKTEVNDVIARLC
jgi:hypothetical protein